MIDYSPFWKTLEKSDENWYTLTSKHHMSHSTLHRLKHGQDISMKTINDLCRILNCQIQDICVYIPSDNDQNYKNEEFFVFNNDFDTDFDKSLYFWAFLFFDIKSIHKMLGKSRLYNFLKNSNSSSIIIFLYLMYEHSTSIHKELSSIPQQCKYSPLYYYCLLF